MRLWSSLFKAARKSVCRIIITNPARKWIPYLLRTPSRTPLHRQALRPFTIVEAFGHVSANGPTATSQEEVLGTIWTRGGIWQGKSLPCHCPPMRRRKQKWTPSSSMRWTCATHCTLRSWRLRRGTRTGVWQKLNSASNFSPSVHPAPRSIAGTMRRTENPLLGGSGGYALRANFRIFIMRKNKSPHGRGQAPPDFHLQHL